MELKDLTVASNILILMCLATECLQEVKVNITPCFGEVSRLRYRDLHMSVFAIASWKTEVPQL